MRRAIAPALFLLLAGLACQPPAGEDGKEPAPVSKRLRMSTTTSTENSGLLKLLLPPFEKEHGVQVDVVPVGTGKALKLGENGDVDLVFVHAEEAERKFVADGFGVDRKRVMHNEFIILGPREDPAGVGGCRSGYEALRFIGASRQPFVSRGDNSGTHMKEMELWRIAGIQPEPPWYIEAGQGMGATLRIADEMGAYTISDRGTYLAFKDKLDLMVLKEGADPMLNNPYSIIAVNPEKHPHVHFDLAREFIDYVTGPEGQKIIDEFTVDGERLFTPDAPTGP